VRLLVGNPTAQSGKNAERIERVRSALACEFLPTEPHGKTIAAVARAAASDRYECIIAMGGDGTFREVASGILDAGRADAIAMAMLPTGTANDQGRSFGLDAGDEALDANLDVIRRGNETRLDAGRITSGDRAAWFFDSAGWGISARVLRERNADRAFIDENVPALKAIYRDQMVYAGALVRVFLQSYVEDHELDAEIVADGVPSTLEGLTDLIVKNTRVYGGAWVFDRTSRHDDGLFEVVPFRGKLDWTSKAIVDLDGNPITEEMLNSIGVEHSRPFRAAKLEMTLRGNDLAAQIDGEEWHAHERVSIEAVPRALRLVVP
jgi:diacylglycerol kinase family enzyme